jgi:PAS domain S-box-containing protein
MSGSMRKTGIKILGDVPWGTHFCQFYNDKNDLLDILIPYFRAGLENNEFCMWICSEPLEVDEAEKAFRKAVPRAGGYLKKGAIEILSHTEWYLRRGRFGSKRVLRGWIDKLNGALARGYDGLRLSGNTFWLEKKLWAGFTAYEETINTVISRYPMIALCTYSLERCGAPEVIDVIQNHQSTLIRREGKWTLVASSADKRAEMDLEKSEERLRLAQDRANVGVWDWKPLTGELYFTPQLERMYGLTPGSIRTYDDWRRRTHPGDIARVEAERDRAIASGESFDVDFRIFHASGETRWFSARGGAIRDEEGNVGRVFGVNVDITERKQMEEALQRSRDELELRVEERTRDLTGALARLRENETLLREVFETVPIGIWVLGQDGKILYANPGVQRIWGGVQYVAMEDFAVYRAWHADTGKIIQPEEWAGSRAVLTGETILNQEVEIEAFDGTRKIIFNSAAPILDAEKRITGAIIINQDITERRRGEKSRREQAALLDVAHDAIYDCALDGTIRFWNHGAEIIYGWAKNEALGKVSHELLQSKFPEPLEGIIEKIIRTGRWEGEFSQVDRRGRPLTMSGRWALKVDEKGRPAGILKINIDITENKKAEEALRTSSRYTRSLIEASLDPLVTISPEGKITDVNRATEIATGYPRKDLIGSDFSDYFTDSAKAREGYRRAFSEGEVRDYPLAIRNAGGGVADVVYNATVYRNDAGSVQGVFAAARDITERKKAEEERLRLAKALEQTAEGIVIMDREREIYYVNPAFEKISGLRSADILRSTYDDVLRAAGIEDGLELAVRDSLGRREGWTGHMIRRRIGGDPYEVDVAISPVFDESGALKNFVAIERDVTAEVKLQENIRQGQKMEALGTLAGGIAHDFNNILMPILVNTEMALLKESEGSPSAKRLQLVLEAANRGKDLVKQIIAFSRRKDQEKDHIRIGPILKEGLMFLRASIPMNVEIVSEIEAASDVVLGDPTRIHQVLMNLCSNAAYAMREKGGVLTVRLSEVEVGPVLAAEYPDLKPGPYLRLAVSDTGYGMTPEIQRKAFDPFFTTKAPGEGAGMGLPVVHGIVKDLGGAIAVESEVGKGSTFTVFLPWIQGGPDSAARAPEAPPAGTERILFIDDEEIHVLSVPPILEHLGYRVVGRNDPQAALAMFREDPDAFDVVITDQMMPFMTGEALAVEMRRIRPDIAIILCTGFSETINEERAKAVGVGAFLMKPFSVKEIAETIRCVLKPKS